MRYDLIAIKQLLSLFDKHLRRLYDDAMATIEPGGDTNVELENPNKPEIYTSEQWGHDVHRLIRRKAIEDNIRPHASKFKSRDGVREFEQQNDVQGFITSLIENEFTMDPKMADVAADVSERLRVYPKVAGVVLLGSAVHGGAKARELTGSMLEPDLDWGLIVNKPIGDKEGMIYAQHIERAMSKIIEKFHLRPDFHSCRYVNPEDPIYRAPMLHEEDVLFPNNSAEFRNPERDILYFSPSFPPEVNITNRHLFLKRLHELHKANPKEWERYIFHLQHTWQGVHTLKSKHFEKAHKRRDKKIGKGVELHSGTVMVNAMKDLLESTVNEIPTPGPTPETNRNPLQRIANIFRRSKAA